jgi:hypothetical protein
MMVSQVVYFSDMPYIMADSWMPASGCFAAYSIVPIGRIKLFVGFTTVEVAYNAIPTQPTQDAETAVEFRSGSTLSAKTANQIIDQKNSN